MVFLIKNLNNSIYLTLFKLLILMKLTLTSRFARQKMIGWVGSTANLTYDGKTARQVVAIRIWVNDKIPMRSNTH